jgi:hypothetical protein
MANDYYNHALEYQYANYEEKKLNWNGQQIPPITTTRTATSHLIS